MGHDIEAAQVFTKVARKSEENIQVPRDPASLAQYAGQAMAKANGPFASISPLADIDPPSNQVSLYNIE